MGTAMFTGVTGLQAYQRQIDVIASNIANVNTTGYRGSRALFQDLFSQTLSGPRAPVGNFGGSNPSQVGLGVQLGSIDVNYQQGGLTTTGVASDLAIQGNGFFILSDGNGGYFYTRDGSFDLNSNGQLRDPATGFLVQGFQADATGAIDPNGPLTNITIPVGTSSIVRATTAVTLAGNLNSGTTVGDTVVRTVQVYDSLGTPRNLTLTFTKTANPNQWSWATTSTDPAINTITGSGTITFNPDGSINTGGTGNVSITFNAGPSAPTSPFAFNFDFNTVTQLSATSDVSIQTQDGFQRGVLQSFNIGDDGVINGVFSNGLTRVIGQVALATFANNGGLVRNGSNLFRDSPASGLAQVGTANTGGRGSISGGELEGSNVDLGTEFSNLIIAQRAFQANARTITASDTILQETVNLIR